MCQTDKAIQYPLISVLMPVYNVEKYIVEAVESILSQTFTDFELILLDDCSPDGSADIIKTFSDERIVYHRNDENLGLANNLNVGLDMARGKYVVRMDGDDISLPNRLQMQIEFLEANPDIDLCSCGMEMFGKDDKVWIRERNPEQVKITMLFYSPILHASSMWRRESFEKYNLCYRQEAFPAEDYDLWARAVKYCKLVNIPQVLYLYRIHGVQVTKIDNRAEQRTREIRFSYLQKVLPSLSEKDRERFVDYYLEQKDIDIKNVYILKSIYKKVISANEKDRFFEQQLLTRRLKRNYQNMVFSLLQNSSVLKNTKLIFQLRLSQLYRILKYNNSLVTEFIRFGFIGVIATGIHYGVYLLFLNMMNLKIAYTIGYIVSFIFNFIASNIFTFRTKPSVKKGVGFTISHIVNYLLHMIVFNILFIFKVNIKIIPIFVYLIVIPINFVLVRLSLKK